jgi:hypothetical protein
MSSHITAQGSEEATKFQTMEPEELAMVPSFRSLPAAMTNGLNFF